jgi:hypothetical protein
VPTAEKRRQHKLACIDLASSAAASRRQAGRSCCLLCAHLGKDTDADRRPNARRPELASVSPEPGVATDVASLPQPPTNANVSRTTRERRDCCFRLEGEVA